MRRLFQRGIPSFFGMALLTLAHTAHAQSPPSPSSPATADAESPDWAGQTGPASFYGRAHDGRRTASGNRFNMKLLTAAHPWLPFGTRVRVTVLSTGRSVVVTITDRLPSARRVLDLSLGAARLLGIVNQGIAIVSLSPS